MKSFFKHGAICTLLVLLSISSIFAQITVSGSSGFPVGGGQMNAIAYGNGFYVAVGYYGTIVKSADAVNWTVVKTSSNVTPTFNNIAFGNGLFAAIMSDGSIFTSSDATTWTQQVSGTANSLSAIAYGNGQFIAVGNNGTAIASANGTTWTAVNTGASSTDILQSITYTGSKFVMGIQSSSGGSYVRNSTTGASGTWSLVTVDVSKSLNKICYLNNKFFLLTSSANIYTSTDAVTWTLVNNSRITGSNQIFTGFYDGSRYFLFGSCAEFSYTGVFTSTDGVNFTLQPQTSTLTSQNSAFLNGRYFIVGNEGLVSSTDGNTWSFPASSYLGVASNGSRYVAVGQCTSSQGGIYTSTDWANWSSASSSIFKPLNGVTYGGGKFVAVGNTNGSGFSTIATSTDGLSWTIGHTGLADNLRAVTYGNSKYVAVGVNGRIVYSADGSSWTSAETGSGYHYYGVAYVNNTFVAVGGSTTVTTGKVKVKYSTNGVTWTDVSPDIVGHLHSVTYGAGKFVLVGRDNTTGSQKFFSISTSNIASSVNFSSPATVTTPEGNVGSSGYGGISYTNGKFVAIANLNAAPFSAYILSSTDGASWTPTAANTTGRLRAIMADGTNIRVVGMADTRLFVNTGTPLPVKLVNFAAAAAGNAVNLQWQVASQHGIKAYEVERSQEGQSYRTLTAVSSTAASEDNYIYTDKAPAAANYYRLKIVEEDGSVAYSAVRTVMLSQKTRLSASPNPVTGGTAMIRVAGATNQRVAYTLYNMVGMTLQKGSLQGGSNTISLANLKAGKYILQAETGESLVLEKL